MKRILLVVPKILAVQQFQFIGNKREISLPQDRRDNLLCFKVSELPLLPHVL